MSVRLLLRWHKAGTRPLSPYAVEAYRQCAQEVRNIGAAPIFLITPSTTQIDVATESYRADGRCDGF